MKRISTALIGAVICSLMLLSTGCAEIEQLREENAELKRANRKLKSDNASMRSELVGIGMKLEDLEAAVREKEDRINSLREKLGKTPGVDFLNTPEGIVIRLSNRILFALGQDTLDATAKNTLARVGKILSSDFQGHYFRVMGHTDKVGFKVKKITNWELSCTRACTVVRFLVDSKYVAPEHITAAGHSFYDPATPWRGKTAVPANRRVEILVLPKMKSSAAPPVPPSGDLPSTPK